MNGYLGWFLLGVFVGVLLGNRTHHYITRIVMERDNVLPMAERVS